MKYNIKYTILLLVFLCSSTAVLGQQVRFIENKGQWKQEVLYKADIPGGDLYITHKGLVYNLYDEHALHEREHDGKNTPVKAHAIFLDIINANPANVAASFEPYPTNYSYFIGSDQSRWAAGVKGCRRVVLRNIYQGIDFEVTGVDGGIKTAFIIRPGGDKNDIKLFYRGADDIKIINGEVHISHSVGVIRESAPVSFLTNRYRMQDCPSSYVLDHDTLSYHVVQPKGQSLNDSLIIDPSIVFSTFSGSVADNFGFTATFDKDGNGYGGGTVFSVGFPVTDGAYQLFFGGGSVDESSARDVGILKFSQDGRELLYATYLGGFDNEQPHSMSCDGGGNLYIMGTTRSLNYPVKDGYDMTFNGGYDLFISCLDPSGTQLLRSTFLGGNDDDGFNDHNLNNSIGQLTFNFGDYYRGDIRLDLSGSVYIASVTRSSNSSFPLVNATQPVFGGGQQDGWVIKMNAQLNTLLYSSYLGGSEADAAYAVRIDGNKFYVAGGTLSDNLPNVTANTSFTHHGGVDGFIARYSQSAGVIHTKTVYVGTPGYDQNYFISTDSKGRVYVTGQTTGFFPRIGTPYYETNGRQYITVFDENLNEVVIQSAFGAGGTGPKLSPAAFAVDKCDRVYLSGWGGNTNVGFNNNAVMANGLFTTPDAFQRATDGSDFYLIIFNRDLLSVGYASYLGGNSSREHVDGGTSHFDESGIIYQSVCAGCGGYSDFPTSADAYSRVNNGKRPQNPNIGGCNNAVFKFDAKPTPWPPEMKDTLLTVIASDSLNYTFDITDSNKDSIMITEVLGEVMESLPNKATLKIVDYLPGVLKMKLSWTAACNQVNDTFVLDLKLKDNACDGAQTGDGVIRIVVKEIPRTNIDFACLHRSGPNDVILYWKPGWIVPSDLKFHSRINIYRNQDGGAYDSVASVLKTEMANDYTDRNLDSPEIINYCYRVLTVNTCEQKSLFSRESCTLVKDSIDTTAYGFSRDTLFYVYASDTLDATLMIRDNDFKDSLFVDYQGSLLDEKSAKISNTNDLGYAEIRIHMQPGCDQVGDTFYLDFGIQDNRCPIPVKDKGRLRVVVLPPPGVVCTDPGCLKNLGNGEVAFTWPDAPYQRLLKEYRLIHRNAIGEYDVAGTFFPGISGETIFRIPDPFTEVNCYAIVAYDYCNIAGDTSEYTCTPWEDRFYPETLFPDYVTVMNNKHIELKWTVAADWEKTELFRFDPVSSGKSILEVYEKGSTDSVRTDEAVDVQKNRYCYVLEPTNGCGLKPKYNPYACSILLDGETSPFEHSLAWTEYDFFKWGTEHHALFKRDHTQEQFELKGTFKNKSSWTLDNTLNTRAGIFYYYAEASEAVPGMNKSRSNTIELIQSPVLHVPNAYSPNNDGINDAWNIVPAFVKDYHLRVYDRWGKLVFETKDRFTQLTDKDLTGGILPCDVYAYVITYTGFEGSFKQLTGNVTILK